MSESTHFMTPIMFCVRLEVPKVQEMAHTKQEFEAQHSFQTNQLGNAIVPRWKMPCEGYQEALRFIQLSLILNIGACRLAIPKVYNGTLQKHPILLIMPEIEVNLKHRGSVKPIRKGLSCDGSICNRHVHSRSRCTQIHCTQHGTEIGKSGRLCCHLDVVVFRGS